MQNQEVSSLVQYQKCIRICPILIHITCMYVTFFFLLLLSMLSNVDLSYSWHFYRPATEVPVSDGLPGPFYRKPPILVQSKHSPFSIKPSAGTLNAQDTINFTFFFSPQKVFLVYASIYMYVRTYVHVHVCYT